PFVEKVWNRAAAIGKENYTIIIHGKAVHEETRATFSHAKKHSAAIIIRDLHEAEYLSKAILGEMGEAEFYNFFNRKISEKFNVQEDLKKIGVVNQTTMLATETQAIADFLRETMIKKYGSENLREHFSDTSDTLCYATNDNQSATIGLTREPADLAIVIGGYNSSNTSHLVELLEQKFPTYFISDASKIISNSEIHYFDIHQQKEIVKTNYLSSNMPNTIAITCGASCPDSIVNEALTKILSFFKGIKTIEEVLDGKK
ncbi:MAG: 4-hydroxy-3-methylbut-2-enyl diphosphate reductase, partial [Bacteroidetes bacterium]|nr:4-hydroxy-3-methylbut-2-enyl diphosphate reductase [Bacteroidota bacterium]